MKSTLPLLLILSVISHISICENAHVTTEDEDLKVGQGDDTSKLKSACASGNSSNVLGEGFIPDCESIKENNDSLPNEGLKNQTETITDQAGEDEGSGDGTNLIKEVAVNEISLHEAPAVLNNDDEQSSAPSVASSDKSSNTSEASSVSTGISVTEASSSVVSTEKINGTTSQSTFGSKASEKLQNVKGKSIVEVKESPVEAPKKAGSKDTTILIVLFVAVVVIGALAFGYNFIKKRRRQADEVERLEKGPTNEKSQPESKPLMEGKETELTEFKSEPNGSHAA